MARRRKIKTKSVRSRRAIVKRSKIQRKKAKVQLDRVFGKK